MNRLGGRSGEHWESISGQITSEVPSRQPSGEAKGVAGCTSLESRDEVQAGEINVGVINA